jgi:hypothetical protein
MLGGWFIDWSACGASNDASPATLDCLRVVFTNLVHALILFAGLTVVIMFIFAGYNVINSSGDPKKIETAKNTFGFGLLGLSIIAFSFLIIKIVFYVTGAHCTNFFDFTCS